MPAVPMLRRSVGVRGEGDLADPDAVAGGAAVLQDCLLYTSAVPMLRRSVGVRGEGDLADPD
ncbi:hypothetical protein, partial [Frankia sp. AvcI1]|uniref:hypothetical protein n=1 Tax=Frankia sp. AvcI1 TaxID=573496 RepID=UPI001F4025F8